MAPPRTPLTPGDLCYYHDPGTKRQCTVIIEAMLEGNPPRRYQCTDLDSGNEFWTFGCWLSPILVDEEPWSNVENETLGISEKCNRTSEEPPEKISKNRFADLSDAQLDEMATNRISKHTQQQTT